MVNSNPTSGSGLPAIAFIQACWHQDIVDQAKAGFIEEMVGLGWSADAIDSFHVPGAFEIPLQAKLLAESGRYGAIVGAGLVVDGGIYRHDFVAGAVINGLMQVQLETRIPVLSVVLTPHNFHEHQEHHDYFIRHFRIKGAEAARAAGQLLGDRP